MCVYTYTTKEVVQHLTDPIGNEAMARLSIYVPDDRMPDIEKWREELSFSQIFLEAFDRAAAVNAKTKLRKNEMKAVVERLKRHTGAWFEVGHSHGVSHGTHWAKEDACLTDLRAIGEGRRSFDSRSVGDFLETDYPFEHQPGWDRDFFSECFSGQGDMDAMVDGFDAGFVDGVKAVWEQIKEAF